MPSLVSWRLCEYGLGNWVTSSAVVISLHLGTHYNEPSVNMTMTRPNYFLYLPASSP